MLNKATSALSKIMRSKKIIVVSSNGKRLEYIPPVVIEPPDFGPTGLIWTTIEQITIDEDFKYYNSELTGNPKVDLQLIYGSKDVHNSVGILTRPSEDNIARIKRNYDISLTKCDDTYLINNGRHRIVYLKHYFADCYQYCDTEEALNTLKQKVTIPILNVQADDIEEIQAYTASTTFRRKASLWERIKESKFMRAATYIFRIRIRIELPNALPEGRGDNY